MDRSLFWPTVWSLALIVLVNESAGRRRLFRDCVDERLKLRENAADVVVTGTVKRLYRSPESLYSGEVQVKRVVKGDHIRSGESLLVEGFGNNEICTSNVRNRDSKIFLLSQLQTGSFRLNSSLMQINILNLDRISAAVKDLPHRRRPPIREELCEKKYCPHNGDCYEDNNRGLCRCPTACQSTYSPICASDGRTYNTECQMRMESCRQQKKTYVKHEGVCVPA